MVYYDLNLKDLGMVWIIVYNTTFPFTMPPLNVLSNVAIFSFGFLTSYRFT
jgi:hypothetical protein